MEPKKPTPRPAMDILPHARKPHPPVPAAHPVEPIAEAQEDPKVTASDPVPLQPQPIEEQAKQPRSHRKRWIIIGVILVVLLLTAVGGVIGAGVWYQAQLQPVSIDKNAARIRVEIEPGSTPDMIAELLKEKGLIRDTFAFMWYTREQGVQAKLQAGTFSLKPSDSLPDIVKHLVAGKTDEFSLTFLPGETIAGHKQVLKKAGYSEAEIEAAFKKAYSHPVMKDKPVSADLEGYIFGETYNFTADASVEQILTRTFDELETQIKQNNLIAAYQKQGLNLYEGITLASIVQKEVANIADSKQVAQVFYKRLNDGMPLGADATFVYAARKAGVAPTVDFDSPYNTRIHQGLTPGPISSPGLTALLAVAAPAPGDYVYFVSGDDGKTYFSRTLAEHEALTRQHCQKNCSLF